MYSNEEVQLEDPIDIKPLGQLEELGHPQNIWVME